jgi:hypothetical protein
MTTKEIENIAYNYLWKKGRYIVCEMAVPLAIQNRYHRDRLDMIAYDTDGTYRGYEIKRNLQDFHSGASWSWICNYNYFIMPNDLYYKVKDEIPDGIGVWVCYEDCKYMVCKKKPKKRELLCSSVDMQFAMLQALSREYKKYRKILEKENKSSKKKK